MKQSIRQEYYRRLRKILGTELNSKNKISAVNTLAVPVVTYSFNIINWTMPEIKRLDTKTRKLLTMNRMHHPKADVERIYLPRPQGGRGMIKLENAYKVSTIGLDTYLTNTTEWTMKSVHQHDKTKKLYSIEKQAKRFKSELQLNQVKDHEEEFKTAVEKAKEIKIIAKRHVQKAATKSWEEKPLHGQFVKRSTQANVSTTQTFHWLRSAGLKAETEGLIFAAQDQSLPTKNYKTHITKVQNDDLCRICKNQKETIDHIIAGCTIIAPTEYLERHNKIARYIHWNICKEAGIKVCTKWYEHVPQPVMETKEKTILWDFSIHTDRTIKANRPDLIIKEKTSKKCLLIDVAVPADKNVTIKEFEKRSKYKDLEIEIQRMWHMETEVLPVVIGALGVTTKDLKESLGKLPGKISAKEIQKIALMGTAHILRKILSIK